MRICGFDSDETGEKMANKMIFLHPTIKILKPCKHNWNEVLISKSKGYLSPKGNSNNLILSLLTILYICIKTLGSIFQSMAL
jgi:hypothetical protein